MVQLPLQLQFPLLTFCLAAGEHSQVGQLINKSLLTIAQWRVQPIYNPAMLNKELIRAGDPQAWTEYTE